MAMDHGARAAELFLQGYNCAQSVAVAFCDEMGVSEYVAAKMASSFGGGMGRMREVCGAVSGMLLVLGVVSGYGEPADMEAKRKHYAQVQNLAGEFRRQVGSIVCREILKNPPDDPTPSPRTEEYYRQRPCARMVYIAANILEAHLQKEL